MRLVGAAVRLIALVLLSTSASAAPDFAGYIAVPQIWSSPDRFVIAPNRRWLASLSNEGHVIQIVDTTSGTILRTLVAAAKRDPDRHVLPAGIAITDDSTAVVVRLDDGTTQAWTAGTGEQLSPPPGVVFTQRPMAPEDDIVVPGAYKIAIATDKEGIETISIASGSKPIDPVQLQVSDATIRCGHGVVRNATFDGEDLVFSHRQGPGSALPNDDALPAIAYRLEKGVFRELWRASCENGFVASRLSADGAFVVQTGDPAGPMTVWSLAANRIVARFAESDGLFAVSAGGDTMAASTFASPSDDGKTFTILRRGRRTSFPRPSEFETLVVSPNGKWLAASTGTSTSIWSLPEGAGKPAQPVDATAISNEGVILERRKREDYHGHDVFVVSNDGRWLVTNEGIVFDRTSGKIVADSLGMDHISDDGRASLRDTDGTMRLLDLNTGRTLSVLQPSPDGNGYVMSFPDGCVQVSPGAEKFVRLVRGNESRVFDAAARRAFSTPGCKGVPAAITASEKAFAADRARVAAMAQADADEQARLKEEAEKKARDKEAARKAWAAGAPAREAEARRAAAMVSKAVIDFDPPDGSKPPFVGNVTWRLSHSTTDADAVGAVDIPGIGFEALVAIDKARAPAAEGTGVIAIGFKPRQPSPTSASPSVTALGFSKTTRSAPPSHIALYVTGPSAFPTFPRLDPAEGNLDLARLRPSTWIDIPLALSDKETATLSIEIGAVGRDVIDDVLAFKKAHP